MFLSAAPIVAALLSAGQASTPEALAIALLSQEIQRRQGDSVLCIQVDGADASQSVLKALQTDNRTIVRGSECEPVIDTSKGSYHKSTGRPALLMSVESFHPISEETAEVALNLYRNGLWAVYKTLEVRKSGSTWIVVAVKSHVEA